jgi:hypothetical protein
MAKRPYFAQTDECSATGQRSAHFTTLEEAKAFLLKHGAGSIKQKGANGRHYDDVARVNESDLPSQKSP